MEPRLKTIQDQMEDPSNDIAKRPRVRRETPGDREETAGTWWRGGVYIVCVSVLSVQNLEQRFCDSEDRGSSFL